MIDKKLLLVLIPLVAIITGASYIIDAENTKNEVVIHRISGSMENIPIEAYADIAEFAIVGVVTQESSVTYVDPDLAAQKKLLTSTGMDDTIIYDKIILTDFKISVEEDLFGNYEEPTITVRIPGGEITGYRTEYELSPALSIGDRVTIFVGVGSSYMISSDHYTIIGLYQGTIKMSDISNSKYADSTTTEEQFKDKIKSLKMAES